VDYNIKIIYKPGASNHADALSCRPDHSGRTSNDDEITALKPELFSLDTPEQQALTAAIDLDDNQDLEKEIRDAQQHFPAMDQWTKAYGLVHKDDAIWKDQALVVVGHNDLKRGVISLFHDSTTSGHPGITKTTQLIVQYYWWPGLKHHVSEYIKGCTTCQMIKTNTNPN